MTKAHFEWDSQKDEENHQKHGVSFAVAQYAFADVHRIVAEDVTHSDKEMRYYCFGKVGDGILNLSKQCDSHIRSRLLAERQGDL